MPSAGNTDTPITARVYKYGLVPLAPFPQDAVDELLRAKKLWNDLVSLHNDHWEALNQMRRDAHEGFRIMFEEEEQWESRIKAAQGDMRAMRVKAGTTDERHPLLAAQRKKINSLISEKREVTEQLRIERVQADRLIDKKTLNNSFWDNCKEAARVQNSGLYSQTSNEIFQNFKKAREQSFKTRTRLRKHSFDGSGFFHFRFREKGSNQDGVPFSELWLGNRNLENTRQRLLFTHYDDTGKKPKCRLRVILTGDGRKKQNCPKFEFDMIYHRPLPEDAILQNAKIIRERIGDRFRYHLVVTVRIVSQSPPELCAQNVIGIDLNFTRNLMDNNIELAAIAASNGGLEPEIIFLPDKMLARHHYIQEIQESLSVVAGKLGSHLDPWLKAHPINKGEEYYRLWKKAAKRPPNVTLSFEVAYKLDRVALRNPEKFDPQVAVLLREFWSRHHKKYREMHNLRKKMLEHRKHHYRNLASRLVRLGMPIALEQIDLRDFVEVRDKGNKLNKTARLQRFRVSLSEFRNELKNAADREQIPIIFVNPANTSKTCSSCGEINQDLQSEKYWSCPSCDAEHERNLNAARNIARRGEKQYVNNISKIPEK